MISTKWIMIGVYVIFLIVCGISMYKTYCKDCVQRCVFFSLKNIKTCFASCMCPNLKLKINSHKPDYSEYKDDLKLSGGEYDQPIKLPIKKVILKRNKFTNKLERYLPNIVMIILDDADAKISPIMEAMPFAKDFFELNGTHFTRAYTSTSYCCPARCQIFTGMYGHNNGVTSIYGKHASISAFRRPLYSNGSRQKNFRTGKFINNEHRTLNLHLQNIGYTTHAVGKFINGIENDHTMQIDYVPTGWDSFNVGADHFMYTGYRYSLTNWKAGDKEIGYEWYGTNEDDYITDVISQKATNIIKNTSDKPFFLYIAPTAPHVPMFPAERHRDKMEYWSQQYDKYVRSRPNFNANLSNKPHWLKKTEIERDQLFDSELKWNEMDWTRRMSSLHSVDDLIKNVYNEIKLKGMIDNTIFFLGSDNGYNLLSHKQLHKMSANEESMAIPLYAVGKCFKKNVTDDQLALLIDIAPTIYDILGYSNPEYVDGYSLLTEKKRSSVLFQYKNKDFHDEIDNLHNSPELLNVAKVVPDQLLYDVPPFTAIRTFDHMLVEYYNSSSTKENEYELFNMLEDPYQLTNVYNDKKYVGLQTDLTKRLKKLEICSGVECIYI